MKTLLRTYIVTAIVVTFLGSLIAFAAPSVQILGDRAVVGTGLYGTTTPNGHFTASGTIVFTSLADGSVPCLKIDGDGKLSTGTCGSGVGGSGTVTTSTAVTTGYFPYWGTASALTGTSSIFQYLGRIGIGTSTPSSKLSVVGGMSLEKDDTLVFDGAGTLASIYATDITPGNTGLVFGTLNDAVYLTSIGRLGIGTSTPSALLHVFGDLKVHTSSTLGTIISGLWNGTPIDFSSYTNATAGAGIVFSGDTISASSSLPLARIGASTYSTLQHLMNFGVSAGHVSGGTITDGGSNTVNVAAGTGFVKAVDSNTSEIYFFDWAASSSIAIAASSTRWIGVSYNAGSPTVTIKTSDTWDLDTEFPLGIVVREGNTPYISNIPWVSGDNNTNLIERFDGTQGIRRDERLGGLILSNTGTRNVAVTTGALFDRMSEFSITAIDTSVSGSFRPYYRNGAGGWTLGATSTQWNNTQYDDNTGTLATIGALQYSSRWFYLLTDGSLAMLYGQTQDLDLADILNEGKPSSVPDRILRQGILIGRFIIQASASTPTRTQSAFGDTFSASQVTDHGDLSGLLDDDHTQYLLAAGTRALTGNWAFGGFDITGTGKVSSTNASFTNATTTNLSVIGLTANRLIRTITNGVLQAVAALTDWIAGTTNQITVTDDGDGSVTLSLPQNIHTGATNFTVVGVTTTNLTISGLKNGFLKAGATGIVTTSSIVLADTNFQDTVNFASSTWLKVALNGSDINSTSTFRSNLGLTDTVLFASSTWLKVLNNLSDLNNAGTARTNLGVAIGTNVQAWDADLDTIAGLATTTGNLIVGSNASRWLTLAVGSNGKVLTASSTATNGISWETIVASASPAGSNTQVQYNNSGVTAGDANFTWTSSTQLLSVPSSTVTGFLKIPNGAGGTTVNSAGQVTIDTTSRTFNFYDGTAEVVLNPVQCNDFLVQSTASSTTQYDEYLTTFYATSTLTQISAVNKSAGDVYNFNLIWESSRNAASSTARHATSSNNYAITSTSTPTIVTSFASSTIDKNMVMRLLTTSFSSSSEFGLTYCWRENP